ncbi:MAG: efflux RND transporter periplasmic adaptor subunit, partial [Patescibacteria group bacterium]
FPLCLPPKEQLKIKKNLAETLESVKKIADAVKSEVNMLDWWVQYRTSEKFSVYKDVTSYQSDLNSYTSESNSHLSTLLAAQRTIEDYKKSILDAERDLKEMEQNNPLELAAAQRSIIEKQEKIKDLETGATELEKKSKQLAVQQKQNSLFDAQQNYSDYFIRAPFDGLVVEMNSSKGDSVTSGTVIATLITSQKIVEITLNEIDATQIKVGQKAVLTFDAVADLFITGEVVEIDVLGAVNSGVVSYDAKIVFDVQDDRVKPGMSASINIIIDSKSDTLLAPVSAVKSMGVGNYVEIINDGQTERKMVVTGLSNDTMIEIIKGMEEGEEIITQTINNGSSGASSQNNSASQGRQSGFGGEFRMLR